MGLRTVKYGVNKQQFQHSCESGPGQIVTRSRSHILESEADMSCRRGQVRWQASLAAAEFSSHVIPTLACAAARDLWLRPVTVIRLNMKTRHCIFGVR